MMTKKAAKEDRTREKMICPACGTEMNQHAEKVREPRTLEEAASIHPTLDGLLVEHHSCPGCGRGGARVRH